MCDSLCGLLKLAYLGCIHFAVNISRAFGLFPLGLILVLFLWLDTGYIKTISAIIFY